MDPSRIDPGLAEHRQHGVQALFAPGAQFRMPL
jgi:hypothetical protein